MPKFFIPGTQPEDLEKAFESFRARAQKITGRTCPGGPIFSVTFDNEGEREATVGQKVKTTKSRAGKPLNHDDEATVLAIIPGEPYFVFTDGARRTEFSNPFMVGSPKSIRQFDE